jgi:hypothetical protein
LKKRRRRRSLFKVIIRIMHFTNILEHELSFLECKVNEDVFMNLVSLGEISSPH